MGLVRTSGKTWGMSPWGARYYYQTMVKSSFSYLALIWHSVCRLKSVQAKLKSFQRLALTIMGPLWRGTPTRGLEVICNIRPLELEMRKLAAEAYLRTYNFQIISHTKMRTNIQSRKGHRQWCAEFLD